jgi:hypothetical protein
VQMLVLLSVSLLIVVTGGETVTMQFWRMDSACVLDRSVCVFSESWNSFFPFRKTFRTDHIISGTASASTVTWCRRARPAASSPGASLSAVQAADARRVGRGGL